jgi:lipopolysaccharide transport system permease protein
MAMSVEYYRDLLHVMVAKEFRIRYRSTVLGYLWSVLNPLALALVYTYLFSKVLKIQTNDGGPYSLFLVAGLFPWTAFQNSIVGSASSFLRNGNLIKKTLFPRSSLVIASICTEYMHFLLTAPVLLGFMLYLHRWPSVSILWQLPILLLINLMMSLGLALIVATLNLFFRDLERLLGILMMIWFYLTPVVYEAQRVPDKYKYIMKLNFVADMFSCWQNLFYYGKPIEVVTLLTVAFYALVVLALGIVVYRNFRWQFAEVV